MMQGVTFYNEPDYPNYVFIVQKKLTKLKNVFSHEQIYIGLIAIRVSYYNTQVFSVDSH